MDRVPGPPAGVTSPPVFVDGFGARYLTFDSEAGEAGDPIEVLCFDQALVDAPDFATALGVRVARLASVRHTLFARVRRLDRPSADSLLLVSDRVAGWRLAHVLDVVERGELTLDISAILSLLRQLIPTVALFARHQRELAVGTIGPEHLILTPQSRLVLAEYVLGAAIEKLSLSREQLWRTYRVASTPGATKIWTRSDALGIGIVLLSLLLGRRLRDDEFPDALGGLHAAAKESSGGISQPLSPALSAWLGRALQLDSRSGFQSPHEAQVAFEEMLAGERRYVTTPVLLDAFVARYATIAGAPAEPGTAPEECAPAPPVASERTPVEGTPTVPTTAEAPVATWPAAIEPTPVPVVEAPVGAPAADEAAEPSSVRLRFGLEARGWITKALAGFALLVLIEALVIIWLWNQTSQALLRDGELVVQSRPAGANVTLDDRDLGTSPVMIRLSPGTYTLKVQVGTAEPRVIVVQIRPGVQTVQYLELQSDR